MRRLSKEYSLLTLNQGDAYTGEAEFPSFTCKQIFDYRAGMNVLMNMFMQDVIVYVLVSHLKPCSRSLILLYEP